MLNDERPMVEVIYELQVTEGTWYRWLNQCGSEKNAEASNRTKELEKFGALRRLRLERPGPEPVGVRQEEAQRGL